MIQLNQQFEDHSPESDFADDLQNLIAEYMDHITIPSLIGLLYMGCDALCRTQVTINEEGEE